MNRYDFILLLCRYGIDNSNWEELYQVGKSKKCLNSLVTITVQEFVNYASNFCEVIKRLYYENKVLIPNFLTVGIPVIYIIERIYKISLLKMLYSSVISINETNGGSDSKWTAEDNKKLMKTIFIYGYGEWKSILQDRDYWVFLKAYNGSRIYRAWMHHICPNVTIEKITKRHISYIQDYLRRKAEWLTSQAWQLM